jgi:pyruvate,orthophosphate dikinase
MASPLGKWVIALDGGDPPSREIIGGKAWSIARMQSLGLDVPPAFVVTTRACIFFLETGQFPAELPQELLAGTAWLEAQSGRRFGRGPRPLLVSVRSGAPVSMPGMMDTVLNLGMDDATERALAEEFGDAEFARDTHRRFIDLYAQVVAKAGPVQHDGTSPAEWRESAARITGVAIPTDLRALLESTVRAVFQSWNSRRARRYRAHHGIPDDLGTAVTVQAMVFGNVDERSGTGVVFSRNPLSGEATPFGHYLARAQGEDVVSGKRTPRPLAAMAECAPEAMSSLLRAAAALERASCDVQDVEFTVERGRLFLLQTRSAKLAPLAAVRVAVELAREGLIDRAKAVQRVAPEQARILLSARLRDDSMAKAQRLAAGEGACPGVGIGRVVTDSEEAERRAATGEPVILARPTTSPEDLHGMIASCAVVTELGGSSSHAAVVSRALGRPCVVGCGEGTLGGLAGELVTVDGQSGQVFAGALAIVLPGESENEWLKLLAEWAAAYAPIRVFGVDDAPQAHVADLDQLDGGADPARVADVIGKLTGVRGARGGAIASEPGMRAAIETGLDFIVTDQVLPALLTAVRLKGGT